jgi:flavin-dependent dehydrogenase
LLLEKERAPIHKVCGEFVSSEGVAMLADIGVDVKRLGAAPIRGFRLHGPHRSCEALLPSQAYGLSRFRLDEELLNQAERLGAEVRRGCVVKELREGIFGPSESILLATSQGEVQAQRLIVATGKTDFRPIQKREGRDSGLVGFKMHLRLKPSLRKKLKEHCDLFVFKHGYGGLAPIEDELANFCFLMEKAAVKKIGADWDSLAYHIAKHNWEASRYLDGAEPQFRHFVTVANVPYGFVQSERAQPGIYCTGDQMAVIPSLTGDGMSIAAMTGRAAALAIADSSARSTMRPVSTAVVYQKQMRKQLKRQVDAAYQLHVLFRNPQICDWATRVVNVFPKIINLLFSRTRCRSNDPLILPPGSKRSSKTSVKRLRA